jgi:hypothetical protein
MSQIEIGCGASFTTIRAGWSLGIRCGLTNIIVAERTLAGAERAAAVRELELRQLYVPAMPPCRRIVTVDPQGTVVAPITPYTSRVGPKWITLGTYQDIDDLREALQRRHVKIGISASAILNSPEFKLSTTETELKLITASAADLGFGDEGAPLAAIHARARALGLELCPAEVGPQLRLRYRNQPIGEALHIAMNPIATGADTIAYFMVANGGAGPLLIGGEPDPERIMAAATQFVFVLPQPARNIVSR